jgi:hypothetical protein
MMTKMGTPMKRCVKLLMGSLKPGIEVGSIVLIGFLER